MCAWKEFNLSTTTFSYFFVKVFLIKYFSGYSRIGKKDEKYNRSMRTIGMWFEKEDLTIEMKFFLPSNTQGANPIQKIIFVFNSKI